MVVNGVFEDCDYERLGPRECSRASPAALDHAADVAVLPLVLVLEDHEGVPGCAPAGEEASKWRWVVEQRFAGNCNVLVEECDLLVSVADSGWSVNSAGGDALVQQDDIAGYGWFGEDPDGDLLVSNRVGGKQNDTRASAGEDRCWQVSVV